MALIDYANTNVDCSEVLQDLLDNRSGEVVIPPGTYSACVELNNVKNLVLRGSGRIATTIKSNQADKPALKINGLWFSRLQDIGFATNDALTNCGVLDIDGSVTQGVQGNTFDNLYLNGQGLNDGLKSTYAMTMCKVRQSNGQGSEQMFLNCHFSGATEDCYYQVGYNALNNQFIGGNFQNYDKNGMHIVYGSVQMFGIGFQSQAGYQQIVNNGWDIQCDSGGVNDGITVMGCRTESLRFAKFGGSQPPIIANCLQFSAINEWQANANYTAGDAVLKARAATATQIARDILYVAKATHSASVFNPTQWDAITFNAIDMYLGDVTNTNIRLGDVSIQTSVSKRLKEVNSDYAMRPEDETIFVDTTNGPVTITLYDPQLMPGGSEITIMRAVNNSSTVTVVSGFMNNTSRSSVLLRFSKKSTTLRAIGGGYVPRRWYEVQ